MYINLIGVNLWLPNLVQSEYCCGFTKGSPFNSLLVDFYKFHTCMELRYCLIYR